MTDDISSTDPNTVAPFPVREVRRRSFLERLIKGAGYEPVGGNDKPAGDVSSADPVPNPAASFPVREVRRRSLLERFTKGNGYEPVANQDKDMPRLR